VGAGGMPPQLGSGYEVDGRPKNASHHNRNQVNCGEDEVQGLHGFLRWATSSLQGKWRVPYAAEGGLKSRSIRARTKRSRQPSANPISAARNAEATPQVNV
jgi:hypothetical protein